MVWGGASLEGKSRSEVEPRAAAVDGAREVEVELDHLRDQKEPGPRALVLRLIPDPGAVGRRGTLKPTRPMLSGEETGTRSSADHRMRVSPA